MFAAAVGVLVVVLFGELGALWALFLAQPLYLQAPIVVWLVAPTAALVWRWSVSRQEQEALEQEEQEEQIAAHRAVTEEVASEHTEALSQQITKVSEQTKTLQEGIDRIIQQQQQTAQPHAPSSRVVALADMPRVASLFGRQEQLKALLAKLRTGETMGIFALSGIGGVGKTALTAVAVEQLAKDEVSFPGGAVWIACNTLEGDAGLDELFQRVALALKMSHDSAQNDPARRRAALHAALRAGQRLLLALDNLEPGLKAEDALNTLAIPGQTAVVLTARHTVAPQLLEAITVPPLDEDPSLQLFKERLRQADPERPAPDAAEQQLLDQIVDPLGGLPLAIELTAAYIGKHKPVLKELLRELEAAPLNAAALRDPRVGLRPTFDRSWKVLTTAQKHLFAGLSLLAGTSFPRQTAVVLGLVAGTGTLEKPRSEQKAEDDLNALISASMVEPLEGGRLRLHRLLREYAAGRLDDLAQAVRERLGDAMLLYWLEYARAFPGYERMDALEAEAEGLMGALNWAHEQMRHQWLFELARALAQTWRTRGRRNETLRMWMWANEAARALGNPEEEQFTTHQLAVTLADMGHLKEARAGYERALKLAGEMGDQAAQLPVLQMLAVLDARMGQIEEARTGFQQAKTLAGEMGEQAAELFALQSLAELDRKQGKLVEARAVSVQTIELARSLRNPHLERYALHQIAITSSQLGLWEEAQAQYEQALALANRLGDLASQALELRDFGTFLRKHGQPERGREFLNEALVVSERLGDISEIGKAHQFLAWLERDEGRLESAISHYRKALHCLEQVFSPDAEEVRSDLRQLEIAKALIAFVNTRSGEEARAVLEREQALLLTAEADQFLSNQIEQARQNNDIHRADSLKNPHAVLRRARETNISTALAEFEAARKIGRNLTALTGEEAEHAAQNAAFLAEKLGLAPDDPQIPALQQQLRDLSEGRGSGN